MNKLILLILFSLTLSCQAQNTKTMIPTVDNRFETLDIFLYQKIKNKNHVLEYDLDNNYIELLSSKSNITYRFTPAESYFQIVKVYKENRNILAKGLTLNLPWSTFNKGTWYYFDERGKLIKEIDYDKPFKFTFDDILKFCEREGIRVDKGPILQSTGFHTEISRDVTEGKPWWQIDWLKKPDTIQTIKLDGITGKVLSRTDNYYINN